MYLGKALHITVSGFDLDEVINKAKEICNEQGYQIWIDVYSRFRLLKWKREYFIDLYKPIDFKVDKT